jgi:hypothetical protein
MERVEVTATHLVHRREPPHTRFNVDIPFTDIASATELHRDTGAKGYIFTLKDDRIVEFPANTVVTAAQKTISAQLRRRNIPLTLQTVATEPQ